MRRDIRGRIWSAAIVVALATLSACGAPQTLIPQRAVAQSAAARVTLTEIDGDILKFLVQNGTPEWMTILRDEVVLHTPRGVLRRESGGITNIYNVPPYGAQDLNVRFDTSALVSGDVAEVHFERAVLLSGRPIAIEPILLQRQ